MFSDDMILSLWKKLDVGLISQETENVLRLVANQGEPGLVFHYACSQVDRW